MHVSTRMDSRKVVAKSSAANPANSVTHQLKLKKEKTRFGTEWSTEDRQVKRRVLPRKVEARKRAGNQHFAGDRFVEATQEYTQAILLLSDEDTQRGGQAHVLYSNRRCCDSL